MFESMLLHYALDNSKHQKLGQDLTTKSHLRVKVSK